jgi:hypothetical protein
VQVQVQCRVGVEVGCRLVPLSPREIGIQALPGSPDCCVPLAGDDLCRLSKGKVDPQALISTTSSFRCWRFSPGKPPEAGSVGISLASWGESWGNRNLEDHRVGGDAALSVSHCGPFVALLEQEPEPRRQEISARVEENLEALSGLLLRAVEAL